MSLRNLAFISRCNQVFRPRDQQKGSVVHKWDGSLCVVEYRVHKRNRICVVGIREVNVRNRKMVFTDRGLAGLSKKVHFTVEFSRELDAKDHLIAK